MADGGAAVAAGMPAAVALRAATARFAFSPTARLDAELLLAHALGIERSALLLDLARPVPAAFVDAVARRARQEPVAYITGLRGFWTLDLAVGPGALVPRADSETLVATAVALLAKRPPAMILDLGTGPGTLLLALLDAWPAARGLGVDRSAAALDYARINAAAFGDRARFVQGDWASAIDARFDLVVGNPPYIAADAVLPDEVAGFEPVSALFAGDDGLDDYRRLAPVLPRLMAPDGLILLEIGFDQADAVAALLREQGLATQAHRDLGGNPRVIAAHRAAST